MRSSAVRFTTGAVLLLRISMPAWAALPCQSSTGDCVLATKTTVPTGTYDIRPRNLVVQNKEITVGGAGTFKILANNITLQPGARFISNEPNGNVKVELEATGSIDLQRQGTSKSKIDVTGNLSGGEIKLTSGGALTINGGLIASATNQLGYGGAITLVSQTGNISIGGDPAEGIRANGNTQGAGGVIDIEAATGSVFVSSQLAAKNGDCAGAGIILVAAGTVTVPSTSVIDLRASGAGDGGLFVVSAGGAIAITANVLANGSGDSLEGGTGGEVFVQGDSSVELGRVEVDGAMPDGDGGAIDVDADGSLFLEGPFFARSKGSGEGDDLFFVSRGDVNVWGDVDVSAEAAGGSVFAFADGRIVASVRVRADGPAEGGTILMQACQISVFSQGDLIATGPGINPDGRIYLTASTGLSVAGHLTATSANVLTWRSSAPTLGGATIAPSATIIHDGDLPCCGVSCT